MATVTIEYATTFPHPADAVFAAITDVDREPEWQTELVRTWHEPAGPLGLGSKVGRERKIMGRTSAQLGEVVMFEPNTRLEIREQPGTGQPPFCLAYSLTMLDPETTSLAFRLVIEGIPAMLAPVIRRKLDGDVPKQFDRLRELLSAG